MDKHNPAPSMGWPRWMADQIQTSDYVLMVCTSTYQERAEGRTAPGRGRGANYEGQIINQAIYEAGGRNEKFIPVIFDGTKPDDVLPIFVRQYTYYCWPSAAEGLLRHLTKQPKHIPAPLGRPPALPAVPILHSAPLFAPPTRSPLSPSSDSTSPHASFRTDVFSAVADRVEPSTKELDGEGVHLDVSARYVQDWCAVVIIAEVANESRRKLTITGVEIAIDGLGPFRPKEVLDPKSRDLEGTSWQGAGATPPIPHDEHRRWGWCVPVNDTNARAMLERERRAATVLFRCFPFTERRVEVTIEPPLHGPNST